MGCGWSASSSRPSISSYSSVTTGIRVVHINGHVEEFLSSSPITAGHVTGKPPEMLLCSSTQLTSLSSAAPLGLDENLQPGQLYFLLPNSVFQSESTPINFAALAARLTAIAWDRETPVQRRIVGEDEPAGYACGSEGGRHMRSWKPALDSIEEKSVRGGE